MPLSLKFLINNIIITGKYIPKVLVLDHRITLRKFHYIPSAFGIFVVIVLKMLIRTRKTVTSNAIRPGTISGGTRKLIHDTTTNMPDGR